MITTLTLLFGLLIGSFLSVCIYRIPRGAGYEDLHETLEPHKNENEKPLHINSPKRSFCPVCLAQLSWFENIPLISWVLQRGKCRHCKTPISARYPTVELMSGGFAILSLNQFGFTPTALLVYVFCAALIVVSFIDYDFYIIPDSISLGGTGLGVLVALVNWKYSFFEWPITPNLLDGILGIISGAGFLLVVAELYFYLRKIEGLGLGDVKLLAMTGALFGPKCALYTIFLGAFIGTIVGITMILLTQRTIKHYLPFGPFLALGTIIYIFLNTEVESALLIFMQIYSEKIISLFG